jgi:hypothetical protein
MSRGNNAKNSLEKFLVERKRLCEHYDELLANLPEVFRPLFRSDVRSA